tara:strand:+ start:1007 stop:1780 length:774 start_codon:yes stop_codon:yes gene_type:complete
MTTSPSGQPRDTIIHVVRKGDTLYSLARSQGTNTKAIIKRNKLTPPYIIKPGQKLFLPQSQQYTVRKGDTLYSISRRFGSDTTRLARLNKLKAPYRLKVGDTLRLDVTGKAAHQPNNAAVKNKKYTPPASSGKGFLWPVRGSLISSFGPKKGGLHNDGINIKVPRYTSIKASESGIVVYADNKLPGYGNLILIRHSNGWLTAYAHADVLLVKKGTRVKRGQNIAKSGSTGNVKSPQLHFELRKGRRAVNPLKYLKKS